MSADDMIKRGDAIAVCRHAADAERAADHIETIPAVPAAKPWALPAVEDRTEGFECLAFHRGRWRHVRWTASGWSLGFGGPFIREAERAFAPLPLKPEGADGFFDWKD